MRSSIGKAGSAPVSPLAQQKEVPLAPTARLRWVRRYSEPDTYHMVVNFRQVLQQWFAPDVPDYMRSGAGEWRDVELEDE